MGKHSKLKAPNRESRPEMTSADAFGQLESMYQRTIAAVDQLLQSIEATVEGGTASPALAREAAGLVRALNGISSEQRAREKARQAAFAGIDLPLVVTWYRSLNAGERAHALRSLRHLEEDSKRSGLA